MRYKTTAETSGESASHSLGQSLEQILQKDNVLLLVLDGVTDPHNLGACLRTADAAGVDAVIVPKDRAAGLTPTARKVACGAAESLPFFQVTNLARTMKQLKEHDIWIVGTAGKPIPACTRHSLPASWHW